MDGRTHCALVIAVLLLLVADSATAQIMVRPRRPPQTPVRYVDLTWKHIDILQGEEASGEESWEIGPNIHQQAPVSLQANQVPANSELPNRVPDPATLAADLPPYTGGVRLYFYESERPNARRAAASIEESYRYLVERFDFVPRQTFPFFLYDTYIEFLQTNVFPIQEGTLGVTGTSDLEVTLPYFGDHRLFEAVSRHELVHQFTLQKISWYAREHRRPLGGGAVDPLPKMPLWFVEGIAEYYTHGLDSEAEVLVRDLFVHPEPDSGFVYDNFFNDARRSFLWTYKLGQVRAAFLAETYGEEILQDVLENAWRMVVGGPQGVGSFPNLLYKLTGDPPPIIGARFATWVKKRSYSAYNEARHHAEDVTPLGRSEGLLQDIATSPDGNLVLYRSVLPRISRLGLFLVDRRDLDSTTTVVRDRKPGVETLHPVSGENYDVVEERLGFVAQWKGRDWVYLQPISRQVRRARLRPGVELPEGQLPPVRRVRLELGERTGYDVSRQGIVAVDALALSPDGLFVAIVGTDRKGQRDLWILTPRVDDGDGEFELRRVTDDVYAERDLSWGPNGIVFTSNATAHGRFNLFRVGPDWEEITQLTTTAEDHFDPVALPDGRVMFVRWADHGANVYELLPEGAVRRTGFSTAFRDLSPGPEGGIWGLYQFQGRRLPAWISPERFLDGPYLAPGREGAPMAYAERELKGADDYEVFSLENWEPGALFGLIGWSGGLYGQGYATASDRLRNHSLYLTLLARGSLDSTEGQLFYLNQEGRLPWGVGLFQDVTYRIDQTFAEENSRFLSADRYFGGSGLLRFPLHQFLYLQGDLRVGAVDYFIPGDTDEDLRNPELNNAGRDLLTPWLEQRGTLRFQTEAGLSLGWNTIRYNRLTGPISGNSVLLEGTLGLQPFDDVVIGTTRIDAEQYVRLIGLSNLALRAGAGRSYGGVLARQFYLSSFDTLRGVPFGSPEFLLGRNFFNTTAELQVPLYWLVQIAFADLEAIAGVDFGGAGQDFDDLWEHRVLDGVLGANLGLGTFVLRAHFAYPVDIGVQLPYEGWRTNLSLAYRYW